MMACTPSRAFLTIIQWALDWLWLFSSLLFKAIQGMFGFHTYYVLDKDRRTQ